MSKPQVQQWLDRGWDAVRTVVWTGVEGDESSRFRFQPSRMTQRQLALLLIGAVFVSLLGTSVMGISRYVYALVSIGLLLGAFVGAVFAVFLARQQPLMAWRVASVVVLMTSVLVHWAVPPIGLAYLIVIGVVAYRHRGWIVGVTTVVSLLVVLFVELFAASTQRFDIGLVLLVVLASTGLGYGFGGLSRTRQELAVHQRQSAQSNSERTRLEERARIAREMHDIVAHHMSMIVVRCETAPYRLADVPPSCTEEFGGIGEAARSAMTDMQQLLGVLRAADQGNGPDLAPQPGLAELPGLIDSARDAGVPVESTIELDGEVPQAVGLTAYRVVQEALSNVAKHAPGAPVTIDLRRDCDVLTVTVRNGPSTRAPAEQRGGGHGLVGINERVKLHGGVVHCGPTEGGGFAVRATILVEAGR